MENNKLKELLISKETTVKQAMKKLNETSEQILFTVDENNKLLGTITDGDIRRGIINGKQFNDPVGFIMHSSFKFLRHDAGNKSERAKKMMVRNCTKIPVVDSEGVIVDVILGDDILLHDQQKEKKEHENQVVIMAGGKGTRLDPFTKILPKPLIPIGEKPVMELIMERFAEHGFSNFIFTLNYKKEYLKLFLKENSFHGQYTIDWVEEKQFTGTAGSLALLKDQLTDAFFVANCDSLLDVNFEEVLAWHKEHKASITILGCHNEITIPYGVMEMAEGKLKKISEKPVHDVIVNTGVYLIEPHVIRQIPNGKHLDMTQLIEEVSAKDKVTVFTVYGNWMDIGQWAEYKKSVRHFEGLASTL